ncbi:type VI secretion system baseplate subunit TssG [Rhizobium lemnae]|uniref:Type VI secretion system baseplate subunit TssG n=1 Tax=Rhizobium lemnae TaxID=1214924 RepID=A0ABV8ECQ5_9HYPH|nr:type VI secretion system baseplate subunit TssG [Rhizobium lemnae]MCJ8510231.1 type VI secretion system baseplate subunit TssG [Rhizobium lemnae]
MDVTSADHQYDVLAEKLIREPDLFDPVTALRVAQAASPMGLDIVAPIGVDPAALSIGGFQRGKHRNRVRSLLASLSGPAGSLPPSYDQLIMREERQRSRSLSAFLDIFNGRLSELFADAVEKYRLGRWMRWQSHRGESGLFRILLSLGGFGTHNTIDRTDVGCDFVLRFSGLFADRARHASGLRAMLQELTGVPVQIEQFKLRWLVMPAREMSRFDQPQGLVLGVNASAGSRLRDLTGAFRIVIGPLRYADYLRFKPDSKTLGEVVAVTRLYVGPALDFDVQVILCRLDVPESQLGRAGDPPRLGWNCWTRSQPVTKDCGDAVIQARFVEAARTEIRDAS